MRVLEINTERTWRGGERQTLYALKGFSLEGMDMELLCLRKSPLASRAREQGFVVHEVWGYWGAVLFLALRGYAYDLWHAQNAKGQSAAALAKIFCFKPLVYTRRVSFRPRTYLWARFKYRVTDRVVALTRSIADGIKRYGARHVVVIPSVVEERPVNRQRVEELLDRTGDRGKTIIGVIAAMDKHKDPETMVRAAHELRRLRKDFVVWHFGDGVLRPKVERLISELGLEDVYRLHGHVDEVEDFIGAFSIFSSSSISEGMGSSMLDAFLRRVPVAVADAQGVGEVVRGRGLVSPLGDAQALARAIDRLLNDKVMAAELVKKAYDFVSRSCAPYESARRYRLLFEDLLKEWLVFKRR